MLRGYRLRDRLIAPGLVLAPMSGVTSGPFRRLIKRLNTDAVGLLFTEFISVEAMTRQVRRSLEMMRFRPEERPLAIQIFGFDVTRMRDAARMVEDAGADVLDVNCGCPAPKVVRKGGGCELMRQPEHLANILREVRAAVSIPLTLKMRAGWDDQSRNAIEIARIAESEGVEALAVHGRTRAQLYRGDADWSVVHAVSNAVKVPVLGSGDVVDRASAIRRLTPMGAGETKRGPLGAMIGRGAIANPLVFSEIVRGTHGTIRGNALLAWKILNDYNELLTEEFAPKVRVGRLKQLASQMLRGYSWRAPILRAEKYEQQLEALARARDTLDAPAGTVRIDVPNDSAADNFAVS